MIYSKNGLIRMRHFVYKWRIWLYMYNLLQQDQTVPFFRRTMILLVLFGGPIVLHMAVNNTWPSTAACNNGVVIFKFDKVAGRNCTEIVINLWHGLTVTERWVRCARGMGSRLVVGGQSMSDDDDCFYYHSWINNVVIAFGTLSSFLT